MNLLARFKKLQNILLFFLVFTLIITAVVIGGVSYSFFSDIMIRQIAKSRVDVLGKVSQNLGIIKNSMLTVSNLYFYNPPMKDILRKKVFSDGDAAGIEDSFKRLNAMYATAMDNKDIKIDYIVAMNNGFSYSTKGNDSSGMIEEYKKQLWYRDITNNGENLTWVSSSDSINIGDREFMFSAARCIQDNDYNNLGLFLVNINENIISKAYENLIGDNMIYIIDQRGKIVSHSDKAMVGFNFYNMNVFYEMFGDKEYNIIEKSGEKYLFSKYHNNDFGWIVVEEIPMSSLLTPLHKVRETIVIISVLVLLAGVIFSIIISKRTSRPLKALCDRLEQVGMGEKGIAFDIKGWSEITKISDECNSMIGRINTLLENVRQTEHKKRRAELDFLQMQINPHFMYNTLFSIKCLVGMEKNGQAEKMIDSFIAFLKNILGSRDELISIQKELDILNEYIYIQKHRFGDKFDIEYICDEELKKYKILRLLLQPIVENSIIHGIEPKGLRGVITVQVEKYNDDLMITIEDNGVGMDADSISLYGEERPNKSKSIGLMNVNARIKLNFGEDYGISIDSQTGQGTVVKMLLPRIT